MKRALLALTLVAVTALALGIHALAATEVARACFASATDTGTLSESHAVAAVSATHLGYATMTVKDLYKDGKYIAARFIVYVDGKVVIDAIYGVADGGSITKSYYYPGVYNYIGAEARGYYGSIDSDATAVAIYSTSCPFSKSIILLTINS
ncbi:MAG: hypothetical protein GXO32_02700 [Crenarchaeota archaeon]|nr:hypothetical protein [Thermoproteota archaeon]